MSARGKFRRIAARVAFFAWIPAISVPSSYLLARHVITLPKPALGDPELAGVFQRLRDDNDRGSWQALHVLYSECGCSQRVLASLLLHSPAPRIRERIVLIGSIDDRVETKARVLGYQFERVSREELLGKYRVEAAPLLIVADAEDRVRYIGGYTERKQGENIRDRDVLASLVRGEAVDPLPTFGCAVSKKLQSAVDPLGLR